MVTLSCNSGPIAIIALAITGALKRPCVSGSKFMASVLRGGPRSEQATKALKKYRCHDHCYGLLALFVRCIRVVRFCCANYCHYCNVI